MAANQKNNATAMEIDRLALQLAKDPHSKVFLPLAEEYCKAGMWQEAAGVLEDGLKYYPGFITAMVVLGRAYDQLGQPTKAKAILEEAVKLSPENLRAHRTLIKIYVAQGQAEAAVRSCNVILALNPRDEEALSIRAKLGLPVKEPGPQAKKPVAPRPKTAPVEGPRRISPAIEETGQDGAPAVEAAVLPPAETQPEASPLQADDHKVDQPVESLEEAADLQPSPHAGAIAQLESFLRSIEQKRKDRNPSENPTS